MCIVDANTQQADTGRYLKAFTPDITDLAKEPEAQTPERIREFLVRQDQYNLAALLGPARADEASPLYINASLYNRAVNALKPLYDYIIVDTPVAELFHPMFADFALPQADFIMVTIAPNVATILSTEQWLRNITKPKHSPGGFGVPVEKIGVVLNRYEDGVDFSEDEVRASLQSVPYLGAIPETTEWKAANNRADLVVTYNIPEINDSFARVLYAATKEEELLRGMSRIAPQKTGLLTRLRAAFGR